MVVAVGDALSEGDALEVRDTEEVKEEEVVALGDADADSETDADGDWDAPVDHVGLADEEKVGVTAQRTRQHKSKAQPFQYHHSALPLKDGRAFARPHPPQPPPPPHPHPTPFNTQQRKLTTGSGSRAKDSGQTERIFTSSEGTTVAAQLLT